jgi:hypothetical protein
MSRQRLDLAVGDRELRAFGIGRPLSFEPLQDIGAIHQFVSASRAFAILDVFKAAVDFLSEVPQLQQNQLLSVV